MSEHTSSNAHDLTTLSETDMDALITVWLNDEAQAAYAERHIAGLKAIAREG